MEAHGHAQYLFDLNDTTIIRYVNICTRVCCAYTGWPNYISDN